MKRITASGGRKRVVIQSALSFILLKMQQEMKYENRNTRRWTQKRVSRRYLAEVSNLAEMFIIVFRIVLASVLYKKARRSFFRSRRPVYRLH
jgi:hypothetical protein